MPYLEYETIQTGNGNLSYMAIDGVQLSTSDYSYVKTIYETSGGVVTKWKYRVTIKPYITSALINGSHTLKVVCSGDKYDMNAQVITDTFTFTFNLVD